MVVGPYKYRNWHLTHTRTTKLAVPATRLVYINKLVKSFLYVYFKHRNLILYIKINSQMIVK